MSAYQAIYDIIAADSASNTSLSGRVYLMQAPQGTSNPYAVMNIEMTGNTFNKDGTSKIDTYRIELDVYHNTHAKAETVANQIIAAFTNYQNTINGVIIDGLHLEGQEPELDGDLLPIWTMDFIMRKVR